MFLLRRSPPFAISKKENYHVALALDDFRTNFKSNNPNNRQKLEAVQLETGEHLLKIKYDTFKSGVGCLHL